MNESRKESLRSGRKSFKTLQHASTNIENLVGRPPKHVNVKHHNQDDILDIELKRKNQINKETQTNFSIIDDLTNPKCASDSYWKVLAEKTQSALGESIIENEKLRKTIEDLNDELAAYKRMLDEANSFVEVVKDLVTQDKDDTGIDINDVSTADEADDTIETKVNDEEKINNGV